VVFSGCSENEIPKSIAWETPDKIVHRKVHTIKTADGFFDLGVGRSTSNTVVEIFMASSSDSPEQDKLFEEELNTFVSSYSGHVQFDNFSTVRAPINFISKGYYEVTLGDIEYYSCLQLGFCTDTWDRPKVNSGQGVGDSVNSWAADGLRGVIWKGEGRDVYRCEWKKGDVIGLECALNGDSAKITVHTIRNEAQNSTEPLTFEFKLGNGATKLMPACSARDATLLFNFSDPFKNDNFESSNWDKPSSDAVKKHFLVETMAHNFTQAKGKDFVRLLERKLMGQNSRLGIAQSVPLDPTEHLKVTELLLVKSQVDLLRSALAHEQTALAHAELLKRVENLERLQRNQKKGGGDEKLVQHIVSSPLVGLMSLFYTLPWRPMSTAERREYQRRIGTNARSSNLNMNTDEQQLQEVAVASEGKPLSPEGALGAAPEIAEEGGDQDRGARSEEGPATVNDACATVVLSPIMVCFKLAPLLILGIQWIFLATVGNSSLRKYDAGWCPSRASGDSKVIMAAIAALTLLRCLQRISSTKIRRPTEVLQVFRELLGKDADLSRIAPLMVFDIFMEIVSSSATLLVNLFVVFVEVQPLDMIINCIALEFISDLDNLFKEFVFLQWNKKEEALRAFKLSFDKTQNKDRSVLQKMAFKGDDNDSSVCFAFFILALFFVGGAFSFLFAPGISMAMILFGPICK
jgi:hypothetical protein